jgi:hypothetical protein
VIFPINFNIPPTKVSPFFLTKINHKTPRVVFPGLNKSNTSLDHTCTLAEAIKTNIANIAFLFTINKINAYKNK